MYSSSIQAKPAYKFYCVAPVVASNRAVEKNTILQSSLVYQNCTNIKDS